jgi:hypothetical protein
MPRTKTAESSRSVTNEEATPEVAPQVPVRETEATPQPKTEGGPKRYESPSGFIIEDY